MLDAENSTAFLHNVCAIHEPVTRRGGASPSPDFPDIKDWLSPAVINAYLTKREGLQHASYTEQNIEPFKKDAIDSLQERQNSYEEAKRASLERLNALKSEAAIEAIAISTKSEKDFKAFINSHSFVRRPYLSLLDNGNLRALWMNKDNEQIGLQFRGDGEIQFVFFATRNLSNKMSRAAGRDTFEGVDRQIAAFDLARLMRT